MSTPHHSPWTTSISEAGRGRRVVELRYENAVVRRETGRLAWACAARRAMDWLAEAKAGRIEPAPLAAQWQSRAEAPLRAGKPQDFDTSGLPLFGDQRHQVDLMDLLR